MKKLISISLIIAIIAPFWISYTLLSYEKKTIKKEIKKQMIAGMEEDELVTLKFSKNEINEKLKWEHSREFEYNGTMYDIVKTEIQSDSIFYHCWKDDAETELNKRLAQLIENEVEQTGNSKKNLNHLSVFFFSFYYSDKNPFELNNSPSEKIIALYYLNNYISIINSPLAPPPKYSV